MFTSVDEFLNWIQQEKRKEPRNSLDNMRKLCRFFSNPEKDVKFIHVAGTNGKGSIVAYLKNILLSSGYNVGTFISPFVTCFNERITYNLKNIEDEDLLKHANYIYSKYDELDKQNISKPSFFAFLTLLSFLYFKEKKVDIAIIEVGIGGLFDSTNVIIPEVSVICSISYDHMNVLGNSIQEIALNKLGIVKERKPFVIIQNDDIVNEINQTIKEKHSVCKVIKFNDIKNIKLDIDHTIFDYKDYSNLELRMLGKYQTENASLAIEVIKLLKNDFIIKEDDIYNGLRNTFWPGRLEVIRKNPLVILDGAHNIGGIDRLTEFIRDIKKNNYVKLYMAISSNKEKDKMIDELEKLADEVIFTQFSYKRSDDAINLFNLSHHSNKRFVENINDIIDEVNNTDNSICVLCGSLYFVSELRKLFN